MDTHKNVAPQHVTISDDGLLEKYWDPAWGDEGAAPQGISRVDPHAEEPS